MHLTNETLFRSILSVRASEGFVMDSINRSVLCGILCINNLMTLVALR